MTYINCKCSSLGNPAIELSVTESGRTQFMLMGNLVELNPDEKFVVAEGGKTMSRRRHFRCDRCGSLMWFDETQIVATTGSAA